MQENEFEKQVKQKMDEFRLRPSAPVWSKIDDELRGKRRRRLLFIPLFAAMLLAGYFTWQSFFPENKIFASAKQTSIKNNTDENKNADNKNDNKITNPPSEIKSETGDNKLVSENVKKVPAVSTSGEKNTKKEKNINNKTSKDKSESHVAIVDKNPVVALEKIKKTNLVVYKDSKAVARKEIKSNDIDKSKAGLSEQDNIENNSIAYPDQNNILAENGFTINNKMLRDNEPVMINYYSPRNNLFADSINTSRLISLQLPSFKNQNTISSSDAVKLGITFSIGASSRINKYLQVSTSEKNAAASNLYATPSSFSNVGGGISILPPSDVRPGAAFKIGVMAMKPVSKRFDISAGLQYSYSSDYIRVGKSFETPSVYNNGASLDVLAQAYNPNVKNESRTNKYHFIELPVSVYYNMNKKWKIPIVLNAGLSFSHLISSDVLLYDETWGGIYYKGNNDLNKTQVNISAGFSFRFTGANSWQWNIGPQVYMGATKLFQSEYDKNKRPVYGGLSIQIILPGKKR